MRSRYRRACVRGSSRRSCTSRRQGTAGPPRTKRKRRRRCTRCGLRSGCSCRLERTRPRDRWCRQDRLRRGPAMRTAPRCRPRRTPNRCGPRTVRWRDSLLPSGWCWTSRIPPAAARYQPGSIESWVTPLRNGRQRTAIPCRALPPWSNRTLSAKRIHTRVMAQTLAGRCSVNEMSSANSREVMQDQIRAATLEKWPPLRADVPASDWSRPHCPRVGRPSAKSFPTRTRGEIFAPTRGVGSVNGIEVDVINVFDGREARSWYE
jgi:hypothetical protein